MLRHDNVEVGKLCLGSELLQCGTKLFRLEPLYLLLDSYLQRRGRHGTGESIDENPEAGFQL